MPWLGFPPAVDLANTVVVTPPEPVDLLTTEDELAGWTAAVRGRIPGAEATRGRLPEVRDLRASVRAALFAAAQGQAVPHEAVAALNRASEAALSYPRLGVDGGVEDVLVGDDAFSRFRAAVARSAIALVADAAKLEVCRAPSCGMLFLRRGARQKWCCDSCGNRSRVARHAARRRSTSAQPR